MKARSVLFAMCILLLMSASCGKDKDENGNDETIPQIENIDDNTMYTYLANAIIKLQFDIWNQNIAGNPVGDKDLNVSGPLGGNVIIKGHTDKREGISTFDLDFTLTDVDYIDEPNKTYTSELVLNGTFHIKGSMGDDFVSRNYGSTDLKMVGNIYKNSNPSVKRNINEYGTINISETTSSVTGIIFGHNISY